MKLKRKNKLKKHLMKTADNIISKVQSVFIDFSTKRKSVKIMKAKYLSRPKKMKLN